MLLSIHASSLTDVFLLDVFLLILLPVYGKERNTSFISIDRIVDIKTS